MARLPVESMKSSTPKIEIVITPEGVDVVRLYGASWADQDATVALFHTLSPWIRQVQDFLAAPPSSEETQ